MAARVLLIPDGRRMVSPLRVNAHPHMSGRRVALVHNGIIENHATLRAELIEEGYEITRLQTPRLWFIFCIAACAGASLLQAMQQAVAKLEGAYALAAIDTQSPETSWAREKAALWWSAWE